MAANHYPNQIAVVQQIVAVQNVGSQVKETVQDNLTKKYL